MTPELLHLLVGFAVLAVAVKLGFRFVGVALGAFATGFRNAARLPVRDNRVLVSVAPGVVAPVRLPDDREERFWMFAELHGRTAEDLDRLRDTAWWHLSIYVVAGLGFVSYLATFGSWFPALPVGLAFAALTFRAAYEHWIFRTRRMGGPLEFLASPSSWWPPSPSYYRAIEASGLDDSTPSRRPVRLDVRRHMTLRDRLAAARVAVVVGWRRLFPVGVAPAPIGTPRLTYQGVHHE